MDKKTLLEEIRSISHRMQDGGELAEQIFFRCFDEGIHSKVDVFHLCRKLDANFILTSLEGVDGVYLAETKNGDGNSKKALIGLNDTKGMRRLKFTLAHELCHHIKDYKQNDSITIMSNENADVKYSKTENFANQFASSLLIPEKILRNQLKDYGNKLDAYQFKKMADYFEVSKSALKYRLDYLNIDYIECTGTLSDEVEISIKIQYINNAKDIVKPLFDKLQKVNIHDIVINDSRFENIQLSIEEIAEIVYDINDYLSEKYEFSQDEVEVIGLYHMYMNLLEEMDFPDQYKLMNYHGLLYKLAPNYIKGFRNGVNNSILGSSIKTTPYHLVRQEMFNLSKDIEYYFYNNNYTGIDFFNNLSLIHQRFTQIHPFQDGNGRVSRFLYNWLLQYENFTYISIPIELKNLYLENLAIADNSDVKPLSNFFINRIYEVYKKYGFQFLDTL